MSARSRPAVPPGRAGTNAGGTAGAGLAASIVGAVALLFVCLSAVLAAVLETLLVPLYAGSTPVYLAVVLSIASNVALPLLGRRAVPGLAGTGLPFACWLVVVVVFGVVARPEGDVILPGGGVQWVSYGLLLAGALAGIGTVVAATPSRRLAADQGSVR